MTDRNVGTDSSSPRPNSKDKGPPDEEAAMLLRFRQGEREAFEWLVRKYRQPAVHFAHHLTGDYHLAEDLAQDCFAHLLVYPEKYDFRASFKTYLYTLLRHKCIDAWRKSKRTLPGEAGGRNESGRMSPEDYPDDGQMSGRYISPYALDDPARLAIVREEDREWHRRMRMLKPDYRLAVYLVDIAQLSYEEASSIMQRSTVSFRVLLHRARKKLRQIYEGEEWDCEIQRTGASISR